MKRGCVEFALRGVNNLIKLLGQAETRTSRLLTWLRLLDLNENLRVSKTVEQAGRKCPHMTWPKKIDSECNTAIHQEGGIRAPVRDGGFDWVYSKEMSCISSLYPCDGKHVNFCWCR